MHDEYTRFAGQQRLANGFGGAAGPLGQQADDQGGHVDGIEPVVVDPAAPVFPVDVVGPVCESGDFFAKDRELPPLERGDLLAVRSAGAYSFVMASNYNARPRAVEVMVDGDRFGVVRSRETDEELIRGECSEPEWKTA